jgi:hypothetical protein
VSLTSRPTVIAALTLLFVGCGTPPPEGLQLRDSGARRALYPTFGEAIVLRDSPWVLIPFGVQSPEGEGKWALSASSGMSFSGSGSPVAFSASWSAPGFWTTGNTHWNNVVFYNAGSGKAHLLFDRRAVIVSAFLPGERGRGNPVAPAQAPDATPRQHLLFAVAEADTNGDGYINGGDAVTPYTCDRGGGQLVPLTPTGTQFLDFAAGEGTDSLYVRVLRDSNRDRHFDAKDETVVLRVDLRRPAEGVAVLDDEIRSRAMSVIAPSAESSQRR